MPVRVPDEGVGGFEIGPCVGVGRETFERAGDPFRARAPGQGQDSSRANPFDRSLLFL